jgi:hypothetical protein
MQGKVTGKTLRQHLRSVKTLQILLAGCPLLAFSSLTGSRFIFPPLGDLNTFVAPLAGIVIGLCGAITWLLKSPKATRWLAFATLILGVVSLISYSILFSLFTVTLHPLHHRPISATVGTERTEFARKTYPGATDAQMVEYHGSRDEDLEALWTVRSLTASRWKLLAGYILMLSCFNLCIGSLAMASPEQEPEVTHKR